MKKVFIGFLIVFCLIIAIIIVIGGDSDKNNYLPNISDIESKYGYNYYEAYTFSYRYALVKASIAGDNYWMRFYSTAWDKYAHNKGNPNRLSQERFWEIMEHADRMAN